LGRGRRGPCRRDRYRCNRWGSYSRSRSILACCQRRGAARSCRYSCRRPGYTTTSAGTRRRARRRRRRGRRQRQLAGAVRVCKRRLHGKAGRGSKLRQAGCALGGVELHAADGERRYRGGAVPRPVYVGAPLLDGAAQALGGAVGDDRAPRHAKGGGVERLVSVGATIAGSAHIRSRAGVARPSCPKTRTDAYAACR
jgi:hypothetical protein